MWIIRGYLVIICSRPFYFFIFLHFLVFFFLSFTSAVLIYKYRWSLNLKRLWAKFQVTVHAKMAVLGLQRYPWTLCLTRYKWNKISIFLLLYFSFAVLMQKWLGHFLLAMEKLKEIKTFRVRKRLFLPPFWFDEGLKSGVAIFSKRVTWNYAFIRTN